MGGAAGKGGAKRRKAGLQRRQQARADAVARVALVGVARVFHPGLAARAQPGADGRRRHPQQRAPVRHLATAPARRHGRQARQPGAARQRQQQGLDLVVRVLRDDYCFDSFWRSSSKRQSVKSLIAMVTRRRLGTLAGRRSRVHPADMQGHAQARAQVDAMALEVVGRRLQAVVHMPGLHLPRPARGAGQQQRAGVGAAAQRHRQRQRRPVGREGVHGGVQASRIGIGGARVRSGAGHAGQGSGGGRPRRHGIGPGAGRVRQVPPCRLSAEPGRSNQAAEPRIVADGRADRVGSLKLVTAPVHAQAMRERGAPDESRIKKARHEIIRVGLGIW